MKFLKFASFVTYSLIFVVARWQKIKRISEFLVYFSGRVLSWLLVFNEKQSQVFRNRYKKLFSYNFKVCWDFEKVFCFILGTFFPLSFLTLPYEKKNLIYKKVYKFTFKSKTNFSDKKSLSTHYGLFPFSLHTLMFFLSSIHKTQKFLVLFTPLRKIILTNFSSPTFSLIDKKIYFKVPHKINVLLQVIIVERDSIKRLNNNLTNFSKNFSLTFSHAISSTSGRILILLGLDPLLKNSFTSW